LFRRALVRQRNIFRVIRNTLQHAKRNRLIVLHRRQRSAIRWASGAAADAADATALRSAFNLLISFETVSS